jgi:hypothetical protein
MDGVKSDSRSSVSDEPDIEMLDLHADSCSSSRFRALDQFYTIHRSVRSLAFYTHTHFLLRPAQLLQALYTHRWVQEAPRNDLSFYGTFTRIRGLVLEKNATIFSITDIVIGGTLFLNALALVASRSSNADTLEELHFQILGARC